MGKQQGGFSLLQAVIVIVLMVTLASVEAPKFLDLSSKANIASLKGLVSALYSAKEITQAGYFINNKTNPVVQEDGSTVQVNTVGFNKGGPLATAAGIGHALTLSGYTVFYTGHIARYTLRLNCTVTYNGDTGVSMITNQAGC